MMAAIICLLTTSFVYAAEQGTAKEAQDLVGKAISYYKANGKDQAFAAINNPKGQFTKKDLYIFVLDSNCGTMAHGGNKALVGKNMSEIKDGDGKPFLKEMTQTAMTKGKGWYDYNWTNPTTKKMQAKSSYYAKEGNMVFGCGIYK